MSAARPLALLGLAAVLCAAWLLAPLPHARARPAQAPLRACLLDVSASAARPRPAYTSWARRALAAEARAAAELGEDLLVVRYASDVERLFGPGDPHAFQDALARGPLELLSAQDGETRLADALALAAAELLRPERAGGSAVLLGDGTYTGRDAAGELAALAERGVGVRLALPGPAERPDLALEALDVPAELEAGAPLRAECALAWSPGAGEAPPLALEIAVEDARGRREQHVALAPPAPGSPGAPGASRAPPAPLRWRVAVDLGPAAAGRTLVRASARVGRPPRADALPENDALEARARAGGALVLVLAAPADELALVERWLAPLAEAGVDLVPALPEQAALELARADVVVTCDLAPASLPAALVGSFVRRGGGWLACAGTRFLAGWQAGRAEEGAGGLLPLRPDPLAAPPRDVVFLVDSSGSMAGAPFERVRAALAGLVEDALPDDRIELVLFTGKLGARVELASGAGRDAPRARRAALERLLGVQSPGGTTAILSSLEELAALREAARREGLVFLLSDGRDVQAFDVPARAAAIRARLAAARTRLVVVAAGDDADTELLGALVAPGEELQQAGAGDLGLLFRRELARERRRCGPGLAARAAAAPEGTLARAVLAAQGATGGAQVGPQLGCFARAAAAPAAELVWVGPDGEPLCALQRVGLGATAAFASAPLADWAPEWSASAHLFGPLVRALGRHARPGPAAELRAGRIEVRGLAPEAPALLSARLLATDGSELARIELAPALPGFGLPAAGLAGIPRAGSAPEALASGAGGVCQLELGGGQGAEPLAVLPLALPRRAEFAAPPRRIALPPAPAAPPRERPARGSHPAGPPVLAGGLVLLALSALLGLGTRRG